MNTIKAPTGRELDAQVAEALMGWTWQTAWVAGEERQVLRHPEQDVHALVPEYSSDMNAAMEVLCKARHWKLGEGEEPRDFFIGTGNLGGYSCGIAVRKIGSAVTSDYAEMVADTIGEAICLAAILLTKRK